MKALRPLVMKGGSAALNASLNLGKSYVSQLTFKSAVRNSILSGLSQGIVKQDISKIDVFDIAMAGLGGKAWGQVIGGITGGLFDITGEKGRVGPGSKSRYQLGVDVSTGGISGFIGAGLNAPLLGISPAWQNGGGFLNQMVGDGFNTVLYPDYD